MLVCNAGLKSAIFDYWSLLLEPAVKRWWSGGEKQELWDTTAAQVTDGEKMNWKRERSVTWKTGQLSVAIAGERIGCHDTADVCEGEGGAWRAACVESCRDRLLLPALWRRNCGLIWVCREAKTLTSSVPNSKQTQCSQWATVKLAVTLGQTHYRGFFLGGAHFSSPLLVYCWD